MIKKILKFIGFGILGFIIIIYFFSDQIMYFFDNNKYLNEVLYVKFGQGPTIIVGLIILFVLSFLFFKLLIWIIKTIYKTNEKYNIVVTYDWKDFLASWGIVLSIGIIISMIMKFEANMIFPSILCFIAGIFGVIDYKNRMKIIHQLGYKGFPAFLRIITTFLFGIISYPIFIIGLIFNMIKMTPSIVETGVDIASDPIGMGEDLETGTYINSDGDAGFYIKNKKGMTLDSDGNITKRVTKDDGTYFDSNGNIGKSKSNKQS